ncbi:MAG: hypothetical protein JSW72_02225 [Candidatus Bathyarchaeota archaeon]|nr:MAG: hypothetical protein JSW72_02225 [Candidatus Bathyarchaeota archaeon]
MRATHIQESLKKFKKIIKGLDLDKRVAATKWLEGVIVAQSLTPVERDELVKASNEYIGDFEEGEYVDAVNAMIEYLTHEQRSTKRTLKKRNKRLVNNQRARH